MNSASPDTTDVGATVGSYLEARTWVGRRSEPRPVDTAVDESRCKYFAALCEDGNPAYWDAEWARHAFGAPLAPSGMLMSLMMPLPWKPDGRSAAPTMAIDVPLPGRTLINVETDCELFRPVHWGERLSLCEEMVDISPEKHTRLGRGHFVTTRLLLLDAAEQPVATITNVLYRYEAGGSDA
ncbi:MaoC family dehydratase N-terminal domain-containing protein [Algiphilus sp. NNCM1]|jgi:acyl dehydratase|uniref:FAS1-like dehydratase domain-containing protein n=1 Tax=Algiphilus sp. TaxID=1872431 RepID=UPI001CA61589|nr:MaoC family dehydratase N-terminal domain-containing protein [Algiphilus sp.]MBY8964443.1 MaoC family dehydratase N-terminal domain-containing protein [Algiphilus acroporae]MCI5063731.1 MaoC family dehydratase N-terminal domain-containing protein [Algiphilus sp.]MCI5103127.1 MaoC family dehydratase N-terminal domain-containing protein [Algiphilus sp.]MCK5771406.1 MaoC family dehydratase N-terminal domain-containing protein [Algiphilus sp.]